MSCAIEERKEYASTKKSTNASIDALEKQYCSSKPRSFFFFFNKTGDTLLWCWPGVEWEAQKKRVLLKYSVEYRCAFRDVWQSASGRCYHVRYHEFLHTGASAQAHSPASLAMARFRGRMLPAVELFAELIPISERECEKLAAQYRIECASGICRTSGLTLRCSRCMKTLYCSTKCQKRHWKQHKAECDAQVAVALATACK